MGARRTSTACTFSHSSSNSALPSITCQHRQASAVLLSPGFPSCRAFRFAPAPSSGSGRCRSEAFDWLREPCRSSCHWSARRSPKAFVPQQDAPSHRSATSRSQASSRHRNTKHTSAAAGIAGGHHASRKFWSSYTLRPGQPVSRCRCWRSWSLELSSTPIHDSAWPKPARGSDQ